MLQMYTLSFPTSAFGLTNIILTLLSTALTISIVVRHRYVLAKPTTIFIIYSHIFFQWPLAFYAPYYAEWLPSPIELIVLVHGLVLIGLIQVRFGCLADARQIWVELTSTGDTESAVTSIVTWLLPCGALLALALGIYLSYVPFRCTGLYSLFVDPASAVVIREISLKLLADPAPRYAFNLLASSVLPVIAALSVLAIVDAGRARKVKIVLLMMLVFTIILFIAMLTGAKGNAVRVALVGAATVFWLTCQTVRWRTVGLWGVTFGSCLLPAYLVTMVFSFASPNTTSSLAHYCLTQLNNVALAQEILTPTFEDQVSEKVINADGIINQNVSLTERVEQSTLGLSDKVGAIIHRTLIVPLEALSWGRISDQAGALLYRTFVVPLEVGVWYVHHGQTAGYYGVSGIPKLAHLFNKEPLDVPNLIGLHYGPIYYGHEVVKSISAGAGYIFSYYSYFGLWSLPIDLAFLVLLDLLTKVVRQFTPRLRIVALACLSIQSLMLIQSDFTTVLVSHGIIPSLLIIALLNLMARWRRNREAVSC